MTFRRSRVFALIALTTLLVSTTEALWASTCVPEMTSGAPPATAAPAHDPGCSPSEESTEGPSDSDRAPGTPHCPLLALGNGGSCVPTSLPAASTAPRETPSIEVAARPRVDHTPEFLLSSPPFHPPKA